MKKQLIKKLRSLIERIIREETLNEDVVTKKPARLFKQTGFKNLYILKFNDGKTVPYIKPEEIISSLKIHGVDKIQNKSDHTMKIKQLLIDNGY